MAFKIDQQSKLEFEITEMLDAGHASEIHLAQSIDDPNMKVAIKRCRRDSQNTEEWLVQVEREISALHHLNSTETPDWSLDMSLDKRLNLTRATVEDRSIIQLISVFDIDGLPAIALEIAPPSITSQQLDKYMLIDVMHQLAKTTHMVHESGVAFTDFNPLIKIPRIRWDANINRIKIIDWNVTRESEEYKHRDLIFVGRIYFQLLTGFPAWSKGEPPIEGLPDRINEYALEITGAGVDQWLNLESAVRDVTERLMIEDSADAIINSEQLVTAMEWVTELANLSRRIEAGSPSALNEMEDLLQEASSARPPQLRHIVDIGSFFMKVAPESRSSAHQSQIESSNLLIKSAYLDRIAQAINYINEQHYSDAVAELENARSRFISHPLLANATEYRYTIARIGEKIQEQGSLDSSQLKELIDKLLAMVQGLESRLWDVTDAETIQEDIKNSFPSIISMPEIQMLFDDIEASKLYTAQIKLVNFNSRQPHIEQDWHIHEAQRLDLFNSTILPNLEKSEQKSLITNRVTPSLEHLQETIQEDQKDLAMVQRFLSELSQGSTSIDIESYLAQSTLDRPHAPLTIDPSLLPKDQSELSADEVAGIAIEHYRSFREQWDEIMKASIAVQDKLGSLSSLVSENEAIIEIFREKLPTVIVPGESNERKTVYKDLEDLTQFVKAVDSVYDELGSIGVNRIPNINKIQKQWMYVNNVKDPELNRFIGAIQANLASHTHEKVHDKLLPPELAMLVYEILDVPIPTEVMQIGQEIQLHKYVRDTLRQSRTHLQDQEAIESVIGELDRLTARNLGELDDAIRQLLLKLGQLHEALEARTIVRQIRSLYRVLKRKVESENQDIQEFAEQINSAVEDLINQKVQTLETALDKAKTNETLSTDEETLVRETQRVIDTLRHNNLLQERRWHHVQNSQAYLIRQHTRALEETTTAFNEYKYDEARQHIERAFRLARLFDMPYDNRLPDELRTAEEMIQQLSQHFTMTRSVETVNIQDIEHLLEEELNFWDSLHNIVKSLSSQTSESEVVDVSFDPESIASLMGCLKQAQSVTNSMNNVSRASGRLKELRQMVDISDLARILDVLYRRLDDLLKFNYTQLLSKQINEIEEIATQRRIISNESIIKRLRDGYKLIDLNKQLDILDSNDSNRRQRALKSNTYTVLRNMHLKNRDERQALAEFIETLPQQDVQSRDFQGVLTRLAEDPVSYAYLQEQVHNFELPHLLSNNNRQTRRLFLLVIVVATVAIVAGLVLSGTLPIEGFTLSF